MKTFQSLVPVLGLLVAGASAWGAGWNETLTTVTITTDYYTTVCPSPTSFTQGSKTYTVTEATTLTITDCPCTIVKTGYPSGTGPVTVVTPTPAPSGTIIPPPISNNGTTSATQTTIIETISVLTTFCPSSSATITIGSQTVTLSSGTNTVPILSTETTVVPSKTPVGPKTTSTSSSPSEFTGAAMRFEAGGAAAMAAGLAALLL